jgi:glucoamylase
VEGECAGRAADFSVCRAGGGFLVRHAPITHQERWEENAGYSPSTLAAVIGGLICAAEIMRAHDSMELAEFLEEFADWIEGTWKTGR